MQFSANFRFSFRHSLSCLIIVETAGALGLAVSPSRLPARRQVQQRAFYALDWIIAPGIVSGSYCGELVRSFVRSCLAPSRNSTFNHIISCAQVVRLRFIRGFRSEIVDHEHGDDGVRFKGPYPD